ncbi:M20 family metallopeptidase [Nonomuraea sp. NPDC005650]|uniref:M20 family metallopeptidase n=1 Tax=Nonomuraea sp. NPDC005650 TaxID=3157045 RepID=UPI0033AB878B
MIEQMLVDLEELVLRESFSGDLPAVRHSAEAVAAQGARLLGARPEVIDGIHLRWSFGTPRVLLLGHHDTVWPVGTLARIPWSVTDGIVRGPGVFDMKAGLVQLFHALTLLPALDGVSVLITGDEEIGSSSSRALIEDAARGCAATLVLEASAGGGALKTARKGTSWYEVKVHGKAAHAGLEPEKGVNAAIEAAHQILALAGLAELAGGAGTTVTPTLVWAGTTGNTVPDDAQVSVDVRVPTIAAQERVDELVRGLTTSLPGARLEVLGGPNRPPLEASASRELFDLARKVAADLGMEPLSGAAVGGASDGNLTAAVGCPTLDGLGAVGGGAHADDEHVIAAEMPVRARLLAGLITELTH